MRNHQLPPTGALPVAYHAGVTRWRHAEIDTREFVAGAFTLHWVIYGESSGKLSGPILKRGGNTGDVPGILVGGLGTGKQLGGGKRLVGSLLIYLF